VRARPPVDSSTVSLTLDRLGVWHRLQGDAAACGQIDLELLVENDSPLLKTVFRPEVARGERRVNGRNGAEFERFTRAQRRHCHVLLPEVSVHGSFALHRRRQILNGILRCGDDRAVGLPNADELNLDSLRRRVVTEHELPPLLHTAFALDFHANVDLAPSGSVVLEDEPRLRFLDDEGLFRVIGALSGSSDGFCKWSVGNRLTGKRDGQDGTDDSCVHHGRLVHRP
jgi:hypothetical protein